MPKRKSRNSSKAQNVKHKAKNIPLFRAKRKSSQKSAHSLWHIAYGISLRTKTLLAVGFLLVIIPIFFYVNEGVQLAFFTPKVVPVVNTFAVPARITIVSVGMDLPIEETAIRNGAWDVATDAISHLTISARPGENGPIILYGHNTNDRFGPIRWLSKGQEVDIVSADGKMHRYIVFETLDVKPSEVGILTSQKGETLILYTCDGFADLQRFVVIAKPVK